MRSCFLNFLLKIHPTDLWYLSGLINCFFRQIPIALTLFVCQLQLNRSSSLQMVFKIGVLRNFTGK